MEFKNDSECIFGFEKQTRAVDNDGKACIPCLDYKEVVLTAAECLYHTGKTAKAKEYVDLMSKKKSISIALAYTIVRIGIWTRYDPESRLFILTYPINVVLLHSKCSPFAS